MSEELENQENEMIESYEDAADEDLISSFLASTVYLFAGPEAYALALAYNLVVYAEKRSEYWREYMDCLESIQKVIFIQP